VNQDFFGIFEGYRELSLRYDVQHQTIWCYYNPIPRPCFTLVLLKDIRRMYQRIIDYYNTRKEGQEFPIRYLVMNSQIPGIFNLGGDLALFVKLIKEKNRKQLYKYANLCVELTYLNFVNLHLPLTTISLVEGLALGGGFESALASNVLIATENAEMGFPEIRFNLFPGMGAYNFLARTCGIAIAEKMITSGVTYGAKTLHKMGIVHLLVNADEGMASVEKYIRQHQRSGNGRRALQQVRQRYHPIDFKEFTDVIEIWADAALRLESKDLQLMERLVKAQLTKISKQTSRSLIRTKQDRRFMTEKDSFPLVDWSGEMIMFDRRKKPDRRLFH